MQPICRRASSVGRLTPAKDPLTLHAAVAILCARGIDLHLDLAGDALAPSDASYRQRRRADRGRRTRAARDAARRRAVRTIPALYRRASVVVNASTTGSVDKVVLEAMACSRLVVTCNEAFPRLLRSSAALRNA